jgi:hypothetical protein
MKKSELRKMIKEELQHLNEGGNFNPLQKLDPGINQGNDFTMLNDKVGNILSDLSSVIMDIGTIPKKSQGRNGVKDLERSIKTVDKAFGHLQGYLEAVFIDWQEIRPKK